MQSYLSSASQPLPASSMASSVAALQRLSASIDVTSSVGATAASGSRSNSRASAYNEDNKDMSEKASDLGAPSEDPEDTIRPQYLTANCVVYTFYNGDMSSAIDDHFNRALKRNSERDSPNHSENSAKQSCGNLLQIYCYNLAVLSHF